MRLAPVLAVVPHLGVHEHDDQHSALRPSARELQRISRCPTTIRERPARHSTMPSTHPRAGGEAHRPGLRLFERFEIINDKNSRQSSLRLSFMKRVVCLPQRPDCTEALSRSLRRDVRSRDSVGALEVGHDEPELRPGRVRALGGGEAQRPFPGHDLGFQRSSPAAMYSRLSSTIASVLMLLGQDAEHSPWNVHPPKPSASIASTMFLTRLRRSICPCGSSER
jgi:hypothetical protein